MNTHAIIRPETLPIGCVAHQWIEQHLTLQTLNVLTYQLSFKDRIIKETVEVEGPEGVCITCLGILLALIRDSQSALQGHIREGMPVLQI